MAKKKSRPGPRPKLTAPTPPPAPPPPDADQAAFLAPANSARASAGLPPLQPDPALAGTASAWASSMAQSGVLSHGDFAGRIAAARPGVAAAENIAEGPADAAGAVALWLSDPPHRDNLLGDYNRGGVGRAVAGDGRVFWCLDLCRA